MATEYGSSSPVDPSKVVCDLREVLQRLKCVQFALDYGGEEGADAARAVTYEVSQCLAIIEQEASDVSRTALNSVYLLSGVFHQLLDRCNAIEDDTYEDGGIVMQVIINALVDEALNKDRISWPQAKKRYKALLASK